MVKKAWETVGCGVESITAAETRRRARMQTLHAARDAGFDDAEFIKITCRRAPDFDVWAADHRGCGCHSLWQMRRGILP